MDGRGSLFGRDCNQMMDPFNMESGHTTHDTADLGFREDKRRPGRTHVPCRCLRKVRSHAPEFGRLLADGLADYGHEPAQP